MEQNNNDVKQENNFEYKELVETMSYSQQSLADFGSCIKHENTIFQHLLVSNQAHQEYATTSHTSQNLNAQQTQFESNRATTPVDFKIQPVNSIKNMVQTTPSKKNSKSAERPKSFRAVEFVLNNLDSVPGEEKFYSWSNKAKDFANIQLSKETREKFYAQKVNSNVANSSDSYSYQPISAVMMDNEQQENQQTDWLRDEASKGKSDDGSSPKNIKKIGKKSQKNADFPAERDRALKNYSKNLMRKKPKSWLLQERGTDEILSSDI